jgi:hypothetical protein
MAILADLVGRFGVGPENVATEALNLILKRSKVIRGAFIKFCRQSGVDLPQDLSFRTQVSSEEHGQPDLVGSSVDGNVLIIEAKFDAGFTENQPTAYFEHFAAAGLLVFIVPEYRRQTVWLQLCERCRQKGLVVIGVSSTPWSSLAQVGIHRLGLISWRAVLSFLKDSAHNLGDEEAFHDLNQLSALCQRMDEDAFTPFRAEELTDVGLARRFAQLMSLPGKVVTTAAGRGICEAGRATAGESYNGQFLRTGRYSLYLGFFVNLWKHHLVSPIWLQTGVDWQQNENLPAADKNRLRSTFAALSRDPSRFPIEDAESIHLPLLLEPGMDLEQLIDQMVRQISEVRNALL